MRDVNLLIQNGVNVQKGLEIFGDVGVYNETLEDFLRAADDKLSKIKTYKEMSDMNNYAILVHSLKSDANYFGFERLGEIALAHENESKANNVAFVNENFEPLINEANRIVALVKQYLNAPTQTSSPAPATNVNVAESNIIEKKSILIVDDSDIISNYIKKVFDDTFDCLIAKDGREALNILEQNSDSNIIGVFLDLYMPNVDGFAVLDYFKEKDLFNKIPVTIITGNDDKEVDQRAFSYPIVDMLKKPFNERTLKAVIDKMMLYIK